MQKIILGDQEFDSQLNIEPGRFFRVPRKASLDSPLEGFEAFQFSLRQAVASIATSDMPELYIFIDAHGSYYGIHRSSNPEEPGIRYSRVVESILSAVSQFPLLVEKLEINICLSACYSFLMKPALRILPHIVHFMASAPEDKESYTSVFFEYILKLNRDMETLGLKIPNIYQIAQFHELLGSDFAEDFNDPRGWSSTTKREFSAWSDSELGQVIKTTSDLHWAMRALKKLSQQASAAFLRRFETGVLKDDNPRANIAKAAVLLKRCLKNTVRDSDLRNLNEIFVHLSDEQRLQLIFEADQTNQPSKTIQLYTALLAPGLKLTNFWMFQFLLDPERIRSMDVNQLRDFIRRWQQCLGADDIRDPPIEVQRAKDFLLEHPI